MRHPDTQHDCPLFNERIYWGDCWIIQDIREDNTDMEFALKPFDIDKANEICEQCRWCYANEE